MIVLLVEIECQNREGSWESFLARGLTFPLSRLCVVSIVCRDIYVMEKFHHLYLMEMYDDE
jgi:hypothetical protein